MLRVRLAQVFQHLCGPLAWPVVASDANRITAESLRQWLCAALIARAKARNGAICRTHSAWLTSPYSVLALDPPGAWDEDLNSSGDRHLAE